MDKGTYDERAKWTEDNEGMLREIVSNPIGNAGYWADSSIDKPWQFLAACHEMVVAFDEGPAMVSHLPVSLDGSCNGLQNFSAMLKDEVGGKATNLVPGDKPEDIYAQVAHLCTEKLRGSSDPLAVEWLRFCSKHWDGVMSRSMAKRPVMVLPYGGTRQSCTQYIYDSIVDEDKDFFQAPFRAAMMLTPLMWDSINETVRAARQAMDWIQSSASVLSKSGAPMIWHTPIGFPVYQASPKFKTKQIETKLAGRLQLRIGTPVKGKLHTAKQRQGSAPNFVHSMDATHLMTMVGHAREAGIQHLAVIHDDFGTHACNTDALHGAIRTSFHEVYSGDNVMENLKAELEGSSGLDLSDLPDTGDLDIQAVLDSPYFFG